MDGIDYKNKNFGEKEWQHVVLMANKKKRNFKKDYNRTVARSALLEAAHILNFMKLYSSGSFLGGQYSNYSVGPTDELTIKNYIRRQDVSNINNQKRLFN